MNQNQVSLVAKLGEKRRADGRVGAIAFEGFQCFNRLGSDAVAVGLRGGAPGLPVEAEELVQQA